jgi:1,4-alpha-glucan branching enzyme
MSLKKQFDERNPICKVTFMLDKSVASSANKVNLAGDFNNWDTKSIPMKKIKSGEFYTSVDLKKGKEYEFKYLIDDKQWVNEPEADKHVTNIFQSNNSVVIV